MQMQKIRKKKLFSTNDMLRSRYSNFNYKTYEKYAELWDN